MFAARLLPAPKLCRTTQKARSLPYFGGRTSTILCVYFYAVVAASFLLPLVVAGSGRSRGLLAVLETWQEPPSPKDAV